MFKSAMLVHPEIRHTVTKDSDPDFLYLIQQGILLSLHSDGILTMAQYRNGERILNEQRLIPRRKDRRGGKNP